MDRNVQKKVIHIVFSYLLVLSNGIEDYPELDAEFQRRYDDFMANYDFALTSTEVCKELIKAVAQTSIWMKGIQLLGKPVYRR